MTRPPSSRFLILAVSTLLPLTGRPAAAETSERFDLVISGGRIVDGTGAPWYRADLGIRGGRIVAIGRVDPDGGGNSIDASGLVVAPGFIDLMGQTATPMLEDPGSAINLLSQGITTINAGEGASAAPLDEREGRRRGWTTMAEYFALLDLAGIPVNVVQTIGHTQARELVLGESDREPSAGELDRMRAHVREAMEAGAIGVSTALIYPPAVYASTEEIAALAGESGRFGGRYYTHMRNEGDTLLEAIDEALAIGRAAGAPVHIFHLKAAGRDNWGKMQLAIARIRAARAAGQEVTADVYPYINNGLGIAALIHPRHFTEGRDALIRRLDDPGVRAEIRREIEETTGWENWFRHSGSDWDRVIIGQTDAPRFAGHRGRSVAAIARETNEDPWDVFFELVGAGAFALPETMTEANKILAMQQEFVSFCTDVGPAGGESHASHPRAYGSFPRLLARYVRDLGVMSLERAVAQASAAAANAVLARDRGRIAIGLAADIVVFDFATVADRADFARPDALSEGIRHVVVNGVPVFSDGRLTGARPGRVLRGPGFRPESAPAAVATGEFDPRLAPFDTRFRQFMEEHSVPGAAVALTRGGSVVLARGYGYADIATRDPVKPESLFRLASLSKPVTAVAVLQLIERGDLALDDRVVEVLDLAAVIESAGAAFDARWRDITIRHLLEHRGGWDRDQSFDPMFQSVRFAREAGIDPPADRDAIIRAMLAVPLDFDPGARYAYSNFGYCLLGRVIEKIASEDYGAFVIRSVFEPLGIEAMRLGATRLDQRAPGEVRYYQPGSAESVFSADLGERVPPPYGAWFLEAMDAHGGWIGSAPDLARFAAAFDDPDRCPILGAGSIAAMFARPPGAAGHEDDGRPKPRFYSLGWSNVVLSGDRANRWHTGSLPGTATIMIRRHDGINMVALLNTRATPQPTPLGAALDRVLHEAVDAIDDWPAAQ